MIKINLVPNDFGEAKVGKFSLLANYIRSFFDIFLNSCGLIDGRSEGPKVGSPEEETIFPTF
jgi:hypothetical protein